MPWSHDKTNGGFSDTKPWLPVAVEHLEQAVDLQDRDPSSDALVLPRDGRLSKGAPDAAEGQFPKWSPPPTTFSPSCAITRGSGSSAAFNLSPGERRIAWPEGHMAARSGRAPFELRETVDGLVLPPWQAALRDRPDIEKNTEGKHTVADLRLTERRKSYGSVDVLKQHRPRHRAGRTHRLRRPLGLRQIDPSADDRGA